MQMEAHRLSPPATVLMRLLLLLASLALPGLVVTQPRAEQHAGTRIVRDVLGRNVHVKKAVSRIVLGEGRQIYAISILEKENPFRTVVGWADDLKKKDPDSWEKYREKFPHAENIFNLGSFRAGGFSVEAITALAPDLLVMDAGAFERAEEAGLVRNLAALDIPTIVVDWREDPARNAAASLLLLGEILGRSDRAREFVEFQREQLVLVHNLLHGLPEAERPVVFVERAAGFNPNGCCATWGPVNFGRFVEFAGGRNWGNQLFDGWGGEVNPEKLLLNEPDFYFVTGANWSAAGATNTAVSLGYSATDAAVAAAMRRLASRPIIRSIEPVARRRFAAIYHQFYDSPYWFVAVQVIAKILHPRRFAGVDPNVTWAELHQRFLPLAPSGRFWAVMK